MCIDIGMLLQHSVCLIMDPVKDQWISVGALYHPLSECVRVVLRSTGGTNRVHVPGQRPLHRGHNAYNTLGDTEVANTAIKTSQPISHPVRRTLPLRPLPPHLLPSINRGGKSSCPNVAMSFRTDDNFTRRRHMWYRYQTRLKP